MKLEVLFEFPLTLGKNGPIENSVFVEFPEMPRVGDRISIGDENFAPLYKQIKNAYLLQEDVKMDGVPLNIIRSITYRNGKPTVIIGHTPNTYIVYFQAPDESKSTIFMELKDVPRVDDSILYDDWYVSGVVLHSSEVAELFISEDDDDDEDDDEV